MAEPESERPSASVGSAAPLPLWKKVLFAGLAVGVFFALPEIILTILDYPPPVKAYNTRPDIFWGLESSLDKKPFIHKELGTTFDVSTNAQSLRYADIPTGQQPKTIRLLALGDSTTFGWGVEQDQTWPAQLEALLQPLHPEVKIQVLNGGVPGYTSFQGLHHFKKNGSLFEPDVTIFGYIVQDARKTRITDKQQAIQALNVDFLHDNALYRLRSYRLLRDRYAFFRSYKTEQVNQEAASDPDATTRVPLDDYKENILTFKKLTAQKKSKLLLFGFPLEVVGYTKLHRELLAEMAKQEGLLHFDPSPTIATDARQNELYFPLDKGHPNAAGCKRIAELFAEYLESSGVIKDLIQSRQ